MKKIFSLIVVATLFKLASFGDDVPTNPIADLEKQIKTLNAKINEVKAHDANDNIKWDIDFRTSFDSIQYKHVSGANSGNPDLLTNRLWLGMAYAPDNNNIFKGKLSYFKGYGDTANHAQSNSESGYVDFDWIANETIADGALKVKEAYWLYMNDAFINFDVAWTISAGRRPSTDGLGINFRENMKDNSPLAHTVNVEFDGLSARFNLDRLTGVPGMWWKFCAGRGLTNAKQRFQSDGADYANDSTQSDDIDMYGFIFVPYDDGQYSFHTNWARAENLIGFDSVSLTQYAAVLKGYKPDMSGTYSASEAFGYKMAYAPQLKSFGDIDLFTAMIKVEGLGNGLSPFLDETKFFISYASSLTNPTQNHETGGMLGSSERKKGDSLWLGVNFPCLFSSDGRFGVEWNKGSKYWRSITYGEDSLAGSKIAARGNAFEIYYTKPITKALNLNARYTNIVYDYTGSNAFFGDDGTPLSIAEARIAANNGTGSDVVEKATDFRVAISYKF